MSKIIKIEPEKWYTLTDLVNLNLFPWRAKSVKSYRAIVNADIKGKNLLKAIVLGKGVAMRYTFRGENIIRFMVEIEDKGIDL